MYAILPSDSLAARKWAQLQDKTNVSDLALDARLHEATIEPLNQAQLLRELQEAGIAVDGSEVAEADIRERWEKLILPADKLPAMSADELAAALMAPDAPIPAAPAPSRVPAAPRKRTRKAAQGRTRTHAPAAESPMVAPAMVPAPLPAVLDLPEATEPGRPEWLERVQGAAEPASAAIVAPTVPASVPPPLAPPDAPPAAGARPSDSEAFLAMLEASLPAWPAWESAEAAQARALEAGDDAAFEGASEWLAYAAAPPPVPPDAREGVPPRPAQIRCQRRDGVLGWAVVSRGERIAWRQSRADAVALRDAVRRGALPVGA